MAPAPGQVLRHARVDLFFLGGPKTRRLLALSSCLLRVAAGHGGTSSICTPLAGRSPALCCRPAWSPARCPRWGQTPPEVLGFCPCPTQDMLPLFPAIRLLAVYGVIRKVVLSQGCFPGAGGTGCWVFCSSPGQSKRVAQRCPASPQHHCISNPASPPSAPHERCGERGASTIRAKVCPLLPVRRLQSNGRVFQCAL